MSSVSSGATTPPRDATASQRQGSPAKTFRNRMGTILRRNSSALSFQNLKPNRERSGSRSSITLDPAPAPTSSDAHQVPSPVMESPAREAAETVESTLSPPESAAARGRSPLVREAKETPQASPMPAPAVLSTEPEPTAPSMPVAEPAVSQESQSKQPTPAVPESTTKPEPTAQPEKHVIVESSANESYVPPPAQVSAPAPQEATPAAKPQVISPISREQSLSQLDPAPVQERGADYFAWGDHPTPANKASSSNLSVPAPVPTFVPASAPAAAVAPVLAADTISAKAEAAQPPPAAQKSQPYAEEVFAWGNSTLTTSPKSSAEGLAPAFNQVPPAMVASPQSIAQTLSHRDSRSSVASSYGQVVISTGGRRVSVSVDPSGDGNGNGHARRGRSRASSVRVSLDDPFADPVPRRGHALSPIDSIDVPAESPLVRQQPPRDPASFDYNYNAAAPPIPVASRIPRPEPAQPTLMQEPPPRETIYHDFTPPPVSMPLPARDDVITSKPIRGMASAYSIGERSIGGQTDVASHHETDERLPLLSRAASPGMSKGPAQPGPSNMIDLAFPPNQLSAWPVPPNTLQALGWTEYVLPDSSFYYAHKGMHIVTDIELRNPQRLEAVTDYLKNRLSEEVPIGWELWLRDVGATRHDFSPVKHWVNHQARILSFDPPLSLTGGAEAVRDRVPDDDRLDMEYRYWAFLEGHPGHVPLPENAHNEAMDALKWSYTDCLLPSQRPDAPPFQPQECQDLMNLLKSFSKDTPKSTNTVVHTRIVARVLLRLVQWRQHHFRPNKPLPHDASRHRAPERRMPFRRAFMDIIISVLCLGIPYVFMERTHHSRIDEESGLRNSGAMLVIGACACLVSAIILSASVTFISLPGLDDVARLAGLIAILFSASSMVSAVVALFRYKTDVERTVMYVGGEGLMLLSRRSILMSLPLVFLAWAIAAFITGVTFYSFRGVTLTSRVIIREPFEDYTHWAMVGTLGGLGGMLLVSAILARR